LAWGVFSYIKETISSPWSDEDRCPEQESCEGVLRFVENIEFNGEPFALWKCDRCDVEVLRGVRGRDIIRTTDTAMSK
jgi:hypothetical protein